MSNPEKEITLKDLFKHLKFWAGYLMKRWIILFVAGIIGGGIGILFAMSQKKVYVANLSFVLQEEKEGGSLGGALGLASQIGFDLGSSGGGAFTEANLIHLMKTRSMLEKTLLTGMPLNGREVSLAEYYLTFKGIRQKWKENNSKFNEITFPVNPDRSKFTRMQDSLLHRIYLEISDKVNIIQKDKKISILRIEVKSLDEQFSKTLAETLSAVVSSFYAETKSKKALLNVLILEKQADSIRTELNNAISNVASANDLTFNLNSALNIKRVPSTKRQVDVQANSAILTQLVANLEIARVSLRKETPLFQIIDKPIFPLEVEKLGKSKAAIVGAFLLALATVVFFVGHYFYRKTSSEV